MCVCIHALAVDKKEPMNLKASGEEYIGMFGEKKENGEMS